MFDYDLLLTMIERETWIAFKSVVTRFLGNNKNPDYVTIVANMLEKFKVLGCLISLKLLFFLFVHGFFPENLGAVSEEQGGRFHQDIKKMETRYQDRWNINMMGDYCRTLHPETSHKKKSNIRSFAGKSIRPLNKI
jgi:hypothetical protein